jgi:hypothetical protein
LHGYFFKQESCQSKNIENELIANASIIFLILFPKNKDKIDDTYLMKKTLLLSNHPRLFKACQL